MKKALIFGAADVGIREKRKLEESGIQVTAFSDNNPLKWGKTLEMCPIIPPQDIVISEYDFFSIGIFKAIEQVKTQLIELGVKENQILVPESQPNRIFYNDKFERKQEISNESIVMILGALDEKNVALKERIENKPKKRWKFNHNYWAFKYFVEDCFLATETEIEKDFWSEHEITSYNVLDIDFYILNSEEDGELLTFLDKNCIVFKCDKTHILKKMIVNDNTLKFWLERFPRPIEIELNQKIKELKETMEKNNISIEEVCVVSGAVLQAYGLRDSKPYDDIDIILTERFRNMYGKELLIVGNCIEAHPQNEMVRGVDSKLIDENLILNEKYHFWLRGVKILILDLIYWQRKSMCKIDELKLMDHFKQFNMK